MVDAIQNSFQERLSSFSNTFFCQEDNSGGMVQLNLNLTEHACSKGMTRRNKFIISHACKPVCAHKIDDIKPTVQSSNVRIISVHDAHLHVRNAHAKFGLRVHANCKPRTAE